MFLVQTVSLKPLDISQLNYYNIPKFVKCYDLKYDSKRFNKSIATNIKVLMQAFSQQTLELPCETSGLLSNCVVCSKIISMFYYLP